MPNKWLLTRALLNYLKRFKFNKEIKVYVLRYNMPSEDGVFYVERSQGPKVKKRYLIVPKDIRNDVKQLRFDFYNILKQYNIMKTDIGRLVPANEVVALRKALNEWLRKWFKVQRKINEFIKQPEKYSEWSFISEVIKKYDLKWPPKNLNIADKVKVEFLGPIKIPKPIYRKMITQNTALRHYIQLPKPNKISLSPRFYYQM